MADCIFCQQPLLDGSQTVTLGVKGCESIACASEVRGSNIQVIPGQVVHTKCRSDHVNPKLLNTLKRKFDIDSSENEKLTLRSAEPIFCYKEQCLFCGKPDDYVGRKTEFKLIPVRTLDFQHEILKLCEERQDQWAEKVKARVAYAMDLPAVDAVYHKLAVVISNRKKNSSTFSY